MQYKSLNDVIDLYDAKIVNFGIDFIVKPKTGVDKYTLLDSCVTALQTKFQTHAYIGEPLSVADLYTDLGKVSGVLEVSQVTITNKSGANYAATQFNINDNTSPDGPYVIVPKNAIVELKFPTTDSKGKVR